MLNYNLNIIEPLKQDKKNEDVRPPITWVFESFATASDSTDLGELGFATMSINAPGSDCILISNDDTGLFATDAQFPVTASLTGSNWPITGSTTMSLFTAGITYDPSSVNQYVFAAISASALDIYNNPSYTGSVILNQFSASEFFRFYTTATIVHTKGNIYNPIINWKAINQSPSTDTGNVNGFTASFNIVKDRNVSLVALPEVTGSTVSAFNNQYALNITSSLSASVINDATGSTTMSITIPNAGIATSSLILNQTTPGLQTISASFVASNNNPYNITASVIMNKGNIWNAALKVLSTGSNADSYSMYTIPTQFNIFKDINVDSTVIDQNVNLLSFALTASKRDTLQTNYAFNFQSDVTESNTYPVYQVFTYPTTSLDITPAGTSSIRYDSGSIISYTESPYTSSYNITASAWINKVPSFAANIIVIGGGGSGAGGTYTNPGGGGGAGGYYQNDIQIYPNKTYTIDYVGRGGATALTGSRGYYGTATSLTIWQGDWHQPTTMSIVARGGSGAGYPVNELFTNTRDGGATGGTYTQIGDATTSVTQTYIGASGAADDWGGGGAGQLADGYLGNGGLALGGAGGNSLNATYIFSGSFAPTSSYEGTTLTLLTGSSAYGVAYPNNNGNIATAYGGGGGGASRTDIFGTTTSGGAGGNGVVILSYSGSQKITGGDVTFSNGITTHTFTTASSFIYAIEPKPNPAEQPYQWRTDTLVIAGGGSGGTDEGGGGGAGGYSYNPYVYYELGKTYAVTVGAGQIGTNNTTGALSGSNSYITDTSNGQVLLFAKGGGAGFALQGGSGGGASNAGNGGPATYGLSVNPNYYVQIFQSQGFAGGGADPSFQQPGGGGGAAATGSTGTGNPTNYGVGGIGKYDLSFTPIGVCGGGNSFGGAADSPNVTIFGGGGPVLSDPGTGSAAPANRGGGGGGARGVGPNGGSGGSGKIQIRYAGTARATGGQIETGLISGSYYTLHTFTASGNFIPTR